MTPHFLWGGPFDGYCLLVEGGRVIEGQTYWGFEHVPGVRAIYRAAIKEAAGLDPVRYRHDETGLTVFSRDGRNAALYAASTQLTGRWVFRQMVALPKGDPA